MSGGKPAFLAACRGSSLSCLKKLWRGCVRHKPEWITPSHKLTTYMSIVFSLWASPLGLLLSWLLRFLGRITTWHFLHCDVAFFAARWIRRHLEMTSWDKSWSSVSRHDLLLKSALKNQPKWLAKDHPGYLWQWQLKSALLCSSLCPKQWFIISLFSRT